MMEGQHLHYDIHGCQETTLWSTFFLSLCGFQKQTQVAMFVWQVPYPLNHSTILSFRYCYSYIMPVLLAPQANSYVYKDYFPNPNIKASTKNAVQPCPKKPTFKNTSFISKNRC